MTRGLEDEYTILPFLCVFPSFNLFLLDLIWLKYSHLLYLWITSYSHYSLLHPTILPSKPQT